jgi:anti-sigma B factor antagonist
MELGKTLEGEVAMLHCVGRLNMVAAPRLRALVDQTVAEGQVHIVVNLTETSFVDSSGLGALIGGLKVAREAGGDLRIAGAPEQVLTVLQLTNLDRVLRSYDTAAEASRDW